MIFQHYRELVTGEADKEWFGMTPTAIEADTKHLRKEATRPTATNVVAAEKAARKQKREAAASVAELSTAAPTAPVLTVLPVSAATPAVAGATTPA